LAALLPVEHPEVQVLASLAGRVRRPRPLPCPVRVGGFGGPDGLAAYLDEARHDLLVDATHPFAARMPWHAAEAARAAGVPRLRLLRPSWQPGPTDRWVRVAHFDEVPGALTALGSRRPFLALGRRHAGTLLPLVTTAGGVRRHVVLRSVDAPERDLGSQVEVILGRGPFGVSDEIALMRDRAVDSVVARDSGGPTSAKLVAARALGLPVVLVDRPIGPPGEQAGTVTDALAWVGRHLACSDRPDPRTSSG
jgi:precorrin-6A/cobalt-precorrin-6A reductase